MARNPVPRSVSLDAMELLSKPELLRLADELAESLVAADALLCENPDLVPTLLLILEEDILAGPSAKRRKMPVIKSASP